MSGGGGRDASESLRVQTLDRKGVGMWAAVRHGECWFACPGCRPLFIVARVTGAHNLKDVVRPRSKAANPARSRDRVEIKSNVLPFDLDVSLVYFSYSVSHSSSVSPQINTQ